MKKLLVSVLFLTSFGVAMAQMTPGGANDPYGHMDDWNPPVPNPNSCGTHKEKKVVITARTDSSGRSISNPVCQSPWHYSSSVYFSGPLAGQLIPELEHAVNQPFLSPLRLPDLPGQRDRDPMNAAATAYSRAVHDSNGNYIGNQFELCSGGNCSQYNNNPGLCNSVTLVRRTAFNPFRSGLAQWYSIFSALFTSAVPANNNTVSSADMAQVAGDIRGCQWYVEKKVVEEEKPNYCPKPQECEQIGSRIFMLQSRIKGLTAELETPNLSAEVKERIKVQIKHLQAELDESLISCQRNNTCLFTSASIDAAGLPSGYAMCSTKPYCPCPIHGGAIDESACRPKPYCRRQS